MVWCRLGADGAIDKVVVPPAAPGLAPDVADLRAHLAATRAPFWAQAGPLDATDLRVTALNGDALPLATLLQELTPRTSETTPLTVTRVVRSAVTLTAPPFAALGNLRPPPVADVAPSRSTHALPLVVSATTAIVRSPKSSGAGDLPVFTVSRDANVMATTSVATIARRGRDVAVVRRNRDRRTNASLRRQRSIVLSVP